VAVGHTDGRGEPCARETERPSLASGNPRLRFLWDRPGDSGRDHRCLPEAGVAYGPGDGVVLASSALGLPIQGGTGISELAGRSWLGSTLDPSVTRGCSIREPPRSPTRSSTGSAMPMPRLRKAGLGCVLDRDCRESANHSSSRAELQPCSDHQDRVSHFVCRVVL
jgi:hypothetical protein